jgi:hypothetical protein
MLKPPRTLMESSPAASVTEVNPSVNDPGTLFDSLVATGMHEWQGYRVIADTFGDSAARPFRKEAWLRLTQDNGKGWKLMDALQAIWSECPDIADDMFAEAVLGGHLRPWSMESRKPGQVGETRALSVWGPWITRLPDGMSVKGDLSLECGRLSALPSRLSVRGSLVAVRGAFSRMGDGLKVGWDLNLWACQRLIGLGGRVEVGRMLNLSNCTSLVSIPDDIRVGWGIDMIGCDAWDGRFPEGLQPNLVVQTDLHPSFLMTLGEWRKLHPKGERP